MMKKLIFLGFLFSAYCSHAQDSSRRAINVQNSENIDPDCESKHDGNILFVNNSGYKLDITVEGKSDEGGQYQPTMEFRVTVNRGTDTPLMGIPAGGYAFSMYAYDANGSMIRTSGTYFSGFVRVFKCKETMVKIK